MSNWVINVENGNIYTNIMLNASVYQGGNEILKSKTFDSGISLDNLTAE